jgi:cytochrome c oxidase subunit 1
VIGIQYLITTIVFFGDRRTFAMFMRAELARPVWIVLPPDVQRALLGARGADDLLFAIPAFAGIGNYVIPLMIGADMAFRA